MALSEHPDLLKQCPLLGVKPTSGEGGSMSAYDPKRTSFRILSPVLALCSKLVEIGYPSSAELEAYRGDKLCLRVRSVGQAAELYVAATSTGRPVFRREGSRADSTGSWVRGQTGGAAGERDIASRFSSMGPNPSPSFLRCSRL